MKIHETETADKVIEELGGVAAVAKICKIRRPSVYYWKKKGIPRAREQFLRVAYPKLKAWATES